MIYRPDIDGLRAIAVSTVILFHFGVPGFSGGFIGVDVFFVLSGYLIGSMVFGQLHNNKFSFVNFYFRRIRRLFPAFVFVIVATILASYLLLLPREFREFGQSVFASTIYLSNILFYLESGYFDAASHLKPLLHTWSLSVEEQFYLIFPVLAWIVYKVNSKWLFPLFLVLTLLSLMLSQVFLTTNPSAVFYLYPFRAWEMFIGVCFALTIIPAVSSKTLRLLLSLAGLLLILIPTMVYSAETAFPGFSAFLPCLGTCLLLHTGKDDLTAIHQFLKSKIFVFTGKISYSLYLWHWPIFVLYMYDKNSNAGVNDILIMLLVTVLLSIFTWRFIETPIREGHVIGSRKPIPLFSITIMSSLVLMGVGYYFHKTNGLIERFDDEMSGFIEAAYDLHGDMSNCYEVDNKILPNIRHCGFGNPLNSESYTLIWGDSHAGAFKRGYEQVLNENGLPGLLVWSGGCPPVFDVRRDEGVASEAVDLECSVQNQAIKQLIFNDDRINSIVLIGRWSYYVHGVGTGIDAHNSIAIWSEAGGRDDFELQAEFFKESFNKTILELRQNDLKIFVVEQVPEFANYKARVLALGMITKDDEILNNLNELTTIDYSEVMHRQRFMQSMLAELEHDNEITKLDTHKYFCKDNLCSLLLDEVPAIFDNNHISSGGALKIRDLFQPVVSNLIRE